jgi:3-hydroxybutyryl-CoA dehydratase
MQPARQEARVAERWTGRSAERTFAISAGLIDRFVDLSRDNSPIHEDDEFARARGFRGRVAHGMLLGSLLSSVVGTELPGAAGVLQEVRLSFRQPCYAGDEIRIRVQVTEFIESVQTLILTVLITNQDGVTLAKGTVQTGVRG